MFANLENNSYSLYSDTNHFMGKITVEPKSNFRKSEIIINGNTYRIERNKWAIKIFEDDKIKYNLNINPFSGTMKISETGQKIKGVSSLKWGTKLVDKKNNTLLKIRNENQLMDKNRYVLALSDSKVSELEILLTLYGHLYGSSSKQYAVMIMIIGVVVIGLLQF